jgi:enediyne biosynthesis protein E4
VLAWRRPLTIACCAVLALRGASGIRGESPRPDASVPSFTDIASESGLDFRHWNGGTGQFTLPEIMGAGAALLDFDGDGDLDAYLVQGGPLAPTEPARGSMRPGGRLYRNDLAAGAARFVDITERSGIVSHSHGMGVATGDADGDGWTDLYLVNFGADQLWRNLGDGTFEDVTIRAGLGDPRWGVSASFVDFDRDGRLDLFVANYVDFPLATNPTCYAPSSRRDYCGPETFEPQPATLYRNLGDGRFQDVSVRSGIAALPGPGLGVVALDADGDGWQDIYVANDGAANRLWRNRQDGSFEDIALPAGVAVNREGRPEAGMGVDAADADGDGDADLFVTHLTGETNTFYRNLGDGLFEDRSSESGLGPPSLPWTGFGSRFEDLDNDSDLDLAVVNGAVHLQEGVAAGLSPLCQPPQLYLNLGASPGASQLAEQRFAERSATAGVAFRRCGVGRGAAYGDVDNDGDGDILVANNHEPAWLLRNDSGRDAAWIRAEVHDHLGAPALGATILARCGTDRPRLLRVRSDGSYGSASDPYPRFGLDDCAQPAQLRVEGNDGTIAVWTGLQSRTTYLLPATRP